MEQPQMTKVTCRECRLEFVPSPAFDFYPDDWDKDVNVGLCERCLMTKVFAPKPSPVPVPEGYEDKVCKKGQKDLMCSYLGMMPKFMCLKGSNVEEIINERRREGSMGAKGDNCSGPPDFKSDI